MDAGEKVSGGLVVTGGDRAELLKLAVEIFDEMARLVHFFVVGTLGFAVALRRDHACLACSQQRLDDALVGIKGFVRQQRIGLHVRQQGIGTFQVVSLAGSEKEAGRIAQRVDDGVDFSAQPAFAAPDRLVFAIFFLAPALC